jgi:transcriptional regulator with XRE-family HTH domain
MTSLGQRIRQMRKHLELTQEELCIKVGISKGFLSDVENGKRNISSANLLDIAKVLGVSCDYLLIGEEGQGVGQEGLPASLLAFGEAQKLSLKTLKALHGMYQQVLAFRSEEEGSGAEHFDWESLYQGVRGHLEP